MLRQIGGPLFVRSHAAQARGPINKPRQALFVQLFVSIRLRAAGRHARAH